jgi:4-alpha-glucanotransferase
MKRSAGILMHPTSLPSGFGIGDLGDEAIAWLSMLAEAGHSYWQFCPLGPAGEGDSPYQCLCSFAGNPLLISPRRLMEDGLLTKNDLLRYPSLPEDKVEYAAVAAEKERLFRAAFERFKISDRFVEFREKEKYWLDDYAMFCVFKNRFPGVPWNEWNEGLKLRGASAIADARKNLVKEIEYHCFLQFVFSEQWAAVKSHAAARSVRLIGDIPIYVSLDSCDAWASQPLFEFDGDCNPLRVSGVPPDYYSNTGQLWGNPLYRWDVMKKDGYAWWVSRIRKALESADIVRLDHFRGFESFWTVPAGSATAMNGTWVKGPGIDFFKKIEKALGGLPFIAEDLGDITQDVELLRAEAGIPGMKVLQFAFDGNPQNPHLPYAIPPDCVVYTGTHDNDTTAGWLDTISGVQRRCIDSYLGLGKATECEDIVRCAYATAADLCIVPLQDVLCLDSRHRMNTPGKAVGNWRWRCEKKRFNGDSLLKAKEFAEIYGRNASAAPQAC